jgi:hypothetical protein
MVADRLFVAGLRGGIETGGSAQCRFASARPRLRWKPPACYDRSELRWQSCEACFAIPGTSPSARRVGRAAG